LYPLNESPKCAALQSSPSKKDVGSKAITCKSGSDETSAHVASSDFTHTATAQKIATINNRCIGTRVILVISVGKIYSKYLVEKKLMKTPTHLLLGPNINSLSFTRQPLGFG